MNHSKHIIILVASSNIVCGKLLSPPPQGRNTEIGINFCVGSKYSFSNVEKRRRQGGCCPTVNAKANHS